MIGHGSFYFFYHLNRLNTMKTFTCSYINYVATIFWSHSSGVLLELPTLLHFFLSLASLVDVRLCSEAEVLQPEYLSRALLRLERTMNLLCH